MDQGGSMAGLTANSQFWLLKVILGFNLSNASLRMIPLGYRDTEIPEK